MTHIQLDFSKTLEFFGEHELKQQQKKLLNQFTKQFMKVLVQVVTS